MVERGFIFKLFTALPLSRLQKLMVGDSIDLGGEALKMWIDIPGSERLSARPRAFVDPYSDSLILDLSDIGPVSFRSDEECELELGMLAVNFMDAVKLRRNRTIECSFPKDNTSSILVSQREALLFRWNLAGVLSFKLEERVVV